MLEKQVEKVPDHKAAKTVLDQAKDPKKSFDEQDEEEDKSFSIEEGSNNNNSLKESSILSGANHSYKTSPAQNAEQEEPKDQKD